MTTTGPLFEIDTKDTCLLCVSTNCTSAPVGENGREIGDTVNFDKLTATRTGFRMLLRYLNVDVMKLSHFSTASFFHRHYFVKSSVGLNLSVSLCNECSSATRDFLQLFQDFESIRIQLDLCIQQLQEFIEKGKTDEERLRQYRKRLSDEAEDKSVDGDLGLVHSSIAEELRSEVYKKCSVKLGKSLPRVILAKCPDPCDIRLLNENDNGSQQNESRISEPNEAADDEKDADTIPTQVSNPNKNGLRWRRKQFLSCIEKFSKMVKNNEENLSPLEKKRQLLSSQRVHRGQSAKSKKYMGKLNSCTRQLKAFANRSKTKGRLQTNPPADENWFQKFAKFHKCGTSSCWKCVLCPTDCGKEFNKRKCFQSHLMCCHFSNYFSDRIPPGISEREVRNSIFYFFNKGKASKTLAVGGERRRHQCPFCKKEWTASGLGWHLKVHILRVHFEEVIEKMGSHSPNKFLRSPFLIRFLLPKTENMLEMRKRLEEDNGNAESAGASWALSTVFAFGCTIAASICVQSRRRNINRRNASNVKRSSDSGQNLNVIE